MTHLEALKQLVLGYKRYRAQGFTKIEVKYDDMIPLLDGLVEYVEELERYSTGLEEDLARHERMDALR